MTRGLNPINKTKHTSLPRILNRSNSKLILAFVLKNFYFVNHLFVNLFCIEYKRRDG